MAFICAKCHPSNDCFKAEMAFSTGFSGSYGSCEDCGKTDICADCSCPAAGKRRLGKAGAR